MGSKVDDNAARFSLVVGAANVLTGAAALPYATDVYRSIAQPLAVVRPGTVEELQAVVRAAAKAKLQLSVRGGGASYTDGYLPKARFFSTSAASTASSRSTRRTAM